MKPVLTIAVPTFNNFPQLQSTIKSLIMHTDFPYKIVIVNNCVEEGENLARMVGESNLGNVISIINMDSNVGWMGAINAALEVCDTDLFCMMNDDLLFPPNSNLFWRTLTSHFNFPNVGAVGPSSNFIMGVQNVFNLDIPSVCETGLLIGMLMVVRTQLLRDVGGLDETLPGGDDLDLSIRIKETGSVLIADRTSYVHHIGQQTGRRVRGEDWDSLESQEITNNALMKKHGVLAWYLTSGAWWAPPKDPNAEENPKGEEDWLVEVLNPYRNNGTVGVDLGCGDGLQSVEGLTLTSLDIAKKGERGVGGRKLTGADPTLTADALTLPIADKSVDFVLARHLFEHLLDPIEALKEWRRVLKDEGELIITAPDHSTVPSMVLDASHVHAYTPQSLKALLELSGWTVGKCDSVGWGVVVCTATHSKVEVLA